MASYNTRASKPFFLPPKIPTPKSAKISCIFVAVNAIKTASAYFAAKVYYLHIGNAAGKKKFSIMLKCNTFKNANCSVDPAVLNTCKNVHKIALAVSILFI